MRLKPLALLLVLTTLATTADAQRRRPPRDGGGGQTPRTVEESIRPRTKKKRREKPNYEQAGTKPKRAITRTKTRPPASACGKTIGGKSAHVKAGRCRGGGGFSGSRTGTAKWRVT